MKVEIYEPPKNKDEAIERVKVRLDEVISAIKRESNPMKLRILRETLKSNELMLHILTTGKLPGKDKTV